MESGRREREGMVEQDGGGMEGGRGQRKGI